MTRVLLIGYNPPQFVPNVKIEAAHYRTWQFLEPLLDEGHAVCLCAGTRDEVAPADAVPAAWRERLAFRPIAFGAGDWVKQLQAAHDEFQPECVVAVNFSHCLYATKLQTNAPIWMEIYGDMLTIMQAIYHRRQSDRGLDTQIAFMAEVLRKGDIFSGCGRPQCHMLAGELAMVGRLNQATFGYEFTRVILPGSPSPTTVGGPELTIGKPARQFLTQHGVTDGDFVVLWCGGYNTWTDVDTLFCGLEAAMAANPHLHYVSVGASTYSAPDNVYDRFTALAAASPHAGRYHLLGWRPWAEMAAFYRESDVGINIDALHYETIFGTRTRLVEMIAAGLPVVTSLAAELSYLLHDGGAALTFAVGDGRGLGAALSSLAADPSRTARMGQTALCYARHDLSFATTTQPLRAWVAAPMVAPDRRPLSVRDRLRKHQYQARSLSRKVLWRFIDLDR